MIVLDTDYITLLTRGGAEGTRLRELLANTPSNDVVTTIITYEEQTRGWMGLVARAKSVAEQVEAYRRLSLHLDNYRRIRVLPFNEPVATVFQRLRKLRLKTGTMDLKIAATALAYDGTLLTRNIADFRHVPELRVEDWLASPSK